MPAILFTKKYQKKHLWWRKIPIMEKKFTFNDCISLTWLKIIVIILAVILIDCYKQHYFSLIHTLKKLFMKKIMIISAMFLTTTAFAQKFEIGAKAGVNISNFTGHSDWQNAKTNSLVGFHAGGFVSFFLGNTFAIQPEVLFSSQGAKYQDATHNENLTINYINVPVMLKLRSTSGFYIEAGPQLGFKISESSSSIDSLAKTTDLSIAGGIGYHSKIGLGIGARYTAGLSKVGDFKPANGINPNFKNGVIQISLFYTLFNSRK